MENRRAGGRRNDRCPCGHPHRWAERLSSHTTLDGLVRYLRCRCGRIIVECGPVRPHMDAPNGINDISGINGMTVVATVPRPAPRQDRPVA